MSRSSTRAAAALVGLAAALAVAGVAYAHVEVSTDKPVGGAEQATVTFDAEAENPSSGIKSIRVVLPQGIAPTDVTLKAAPAGWTLTAGGDGYTVAGAAQPQGRTVTHSIVVAKLPNVGRLVFKVLVTYANGAIDRWIEEPTTANPNPENPAPVLNLRPGAAATTPPPTTQPAATPSAIATLTPTPADPNGGDGPMALWPWLLAGAAVIAVGLALAARNRSRPGMPGA